MTIFTTKNGRKVYDGGGIRPDILIDPYESSEFLTEIYKNRHFFNFATNYRITHTSIDTNYILNEADYLEFIHYLSKKGNKYKTDT